MQRILEVLRGHDIGKRQAHRGELAREELCVRLGACRYRPVAFDARPVAVVLPVLGEQDERRGVGGLGREGQVEQDERVWIPVVYQAHRVEGDPRGHEDRLPEQETSGTEEPGDRL